MKLTTTIEWHNLLKNPDDLPEKENMAIIVAICKNDKIQLNFSHFLDYGYSKDYKSFYHYIEHWDEDEYIYSDDECFVGEVVAWAYWPTFYDMEAALNKEILGKEV